MAPESKNRLYRNELKYIVSLRQMSVLKNRIRPLMALDAHVGESGRYNIRSVYFDDYRNTCYMENENGTSPREKFRIRIYDGSKEEIHLECKRKEGGKTHKDSCRLTLEQCRAFLASGCFPENKNFLEGGCFWEGRRFPEESFQKSNTLKEGETPSVLGKFFLKYRTELYRPRVIVEYEREPYVYRDGNVRVTFDTGIRSSNRVESFFEKELFARPVMPAGYHLMEVKYDEFLPDHIYRSLQMDDLQQTTFSKYYLCRKFQIGGVKRNGF